MPGKIYNVELFMLVAARLAGEISIESWQIGDEIEKRVRKAGVVNS